MIKRKIWEALRRIEEKDKENNKALASQINPRGAEQNPYSRHSMWLGTKAKEFKGIVEVNKAAKLKPGIERGSATAARYALQLYHDCRARQYVRDVMRGKELDLKSRQTKGRMFAYAPHVIEMLDVMLTVNKVKKTFLKKIA